MINLTVKTLDSQNHAFTLEDDQITVRGFKEYIAETVAVPADSQRLIYCGRVLQDGMLLNDYDVNGKVIHLVQRAPPQPGQRGNDGGQNQGQNHGLQVWPNSQRTHYRFTRAQMHGNAMYLGAMSVPAEVMEGHGLTVPQFSHSLSNSRLVAARHMLERANRLIDRLDSPSRPVNPSASENNRPPSSQLGQEPELDSVRYNTESRTDAEDARLAAAAIMAAWSAAEAGDFTLLRGQSEENNESSDSNEETQTDEQQPQQSQSEQQGSTSSNSDGQSQQAPRPPQYADLLDILIDTQSRLRPHVERYCKLMREDPALPSGGRRLEECQTFVDGVSECLHYMSHICHVLSDIIVDMSQQPPRSLRCRPIIIQHSAILQPSIPIQVEAHISLHGRNANNNNGNEESGESGNTPAQSETNEANTEDSNPQESESASQQQAEQQPQEPAQSPFGTVFNLPNNVEVLMEVSHDDNMDVPSGSEQNPPGENNNNNNSNNNNGGRAAGTTGPLTWGTPSIPDVIRNVMQLLAGQMAQAGFPASTMTNRNPSGVGQQTVASRDSRNTNAGQSTQARSNVGTHPTTATQTRSTSRPHVFHQQSHPLGVGMSIGQAFDFDPFLPCNSHHIRRSSTATSSTVTSTSQGTRTSQPTTGETQSQAQTATTSSATSNTSSSNNTAPTTSEVVGGIRMNLIRQISASLVGQPQGNISININDPDLAESLGSMAQTRVGGNGPNRVGTGGNARGSSGGGRVTVADLLERRGLQMNSFTSQDPNSEDNFFVNLSAFVVQSVTLEDIFRLRIGQWEPMSHFRRPLQEFLQSFFPNATPETLQEQTTERVLSPLRSYFQNLVNPEEEAIRNDPRVDICATVEALFRRHIKDILRHLFNSEIDDARFGQEVLSVVKNLGRQLCIVLRHCIRGGQAGLEVVVSRSVTTMLEGMDSTLCRWMVNTVVAHFRALSFYVEQPPDSEILPLLIYKDAPSQASTVPSAPTNQPSQAPSEVEPMETEAVEEKTFEASSLPEDGEEVPETFPGHEALPSDWVPIIARDGVRQRRQLQMQGLTNVGSFSDAYLGTLPTKRRKLIEQQKPRLLVSPTPNHSAIAASMERLVREGVTRAGVEEVEGAAVAVAVDPGVRRAFGQAIRDCLQPHRYGTADFPDPLRFPNATKYFANQDRPPK